ncbi:MAG: hypothetical protein RR056_05315 [Acetivibrio sp.]
MSEIKKEEQTQVAEVKKEVLAKKSDFSLGIFGTSDNFLLATQMAKALASSTVVPKEYQGNFANGIVAIEMAQRIGTSPLMVMQNLNVIQGRPSWSAQFLIAMANGSGKYDFELQFEETKDQNGKPFSCQCWTERRGRRVDGIVIDMDMAKAEGWSSKNGSKWLTMPQVMLRYRAASFFVRMNCPELALGLYTKEEVLDGDLKEYPLEDMDVKVQREIQQNANSVDFEIDPVEKDKKEAKNEKEPDMDWMK